MRGKRLIWRPPAATAIALVLLVLLVCCDANHIDATPASKVACFNLMEQPRLGIEEFAGRMLRLPRGAYVFTTTHALRVWRTVREWLLWLTRPDRYHPDTANERGLGKQAAPTPEKKEKTTVEKAQEAAAKAAEEAKEKQAVAQKAGKALEKLKKSAQKAIEEASTARAEAEAAEAVAEVAAAEVTAARATEKAEKEAAQKEAAEKTAAAAEHGESGA